MTQVPEVKNDDDQPSVLTLSMGSHKGGKDADIVHKQKLKALTAAICVKALRDAGFTDVVNNTTDLHGKILAPSDIYKTLMEVKNCKEAVEDDDLPKAAFGIRINLGSDE